jgi:hypothetical protein
MSEPAGILYAGQVVHRRLRPRPHRLSYRVFSLLLDVDRIGEADRACRLFSLNRLNALSHYDRDHGAGDGEPVSEFARRVLTDAGLGAATHRIELLAYPRVLGYVFNPLSVYYGYRRDGGLGGLIYEVNNTVGERTCYVVAAGVPSGGVHAQGCDKAMYVSPFTPSKGTYGFRITPPAEELTVGVQLRDSVGPLLLTYFRARGRPLDDRKIASALALHPAMTLKVTGAIHLEALRLLLKRVPVVQYRRSARFSVINIATSARASGLTDAQY